MTDDVKAAKLAAYFASGSRSGDSRGDAYFDNAGQDLPAGFLLAAALAVPRSKKANLAMSDLLEDFRDDDVDEPTSELVYGSVDEFVREYLRHMYTRPVVPGNARYRWAADWWRYPDAVARLEGLWRSWEHLRVDPATGASVWWRDHADHHMNLLLSADGAFAKSKDACEPGEPLPYTELPTHWFTDVRLTC